MRSGLIQRFGQFGGQFAFGFYIYTGGGGYDLSVNFGCPLGFEDAMLLSNHPADQIDLLADHVGDRDNRLR